MTNLNWYWVYVPYLDEPDRQAESALRTGYNKVVFKAEADGVIAELKDENRRLKRALWLARADRALAETYSVLNDVPTSNRWVKALNKLKAKAEEYK